MTMMIEKENIRVNCQRDKCPVFGKCCFLPTEVHPGIDGKVPILFVGQGGGREERKEGRPFIGRAGKRIRQIVFEVRSKLNKHIGVAFSNTIRDNPDENRIPNEEELSMCLPHLYKDIATLKERGLSVVIPLGAAAKDALIPQCKSSMTKDRGKPYRVENEIFKDITMLPTFHPSYLMRKSAKFKKDPYPEFDHIVIEDILTAYEFSQ